MSISAQSALSSAMSAGKGPAHPASPASAPDLATLEQSLLAFILQQGAGRGPKLVAFSGGVDSSLAASLVKTAFPEHARAIIGVSAAMPLDQLQLAREVARVIGIPLEEVPTGEGLLDGYVANAGESCYHCKTTLYSTMQSVVSALNAHPLAQGDVVLFNGTNADDLQDHTRLGLRAASEFRVVSPLAGVTKAQVRALSRARGLPNWDYAASPCLRSRLAYGVMATPENLQRVEQAELHVRRLGGLSPKDNLRVRHLTGDVAAIEADVGWLDHLAALRAALDDALLPLGFRAVTVRPFQTGSVSGFAGALAV